jgi:hypothetical protein
MLIYYIYNFAIYLLDIYYGIKRLYIEDNYITHKDSMKLDDEIYVYEYNVCIKEKVHNVRIISDNKKEDKEIYDSIVKNVDNKQKIVYCSIMNGDECLIDLTNIFREFVYHMDDKIETYNKMEYFFKYIKEKHKHMEIKDIDEYQFVVYMNDDMFSEYKYKVKDLYDKMFKDIIDAELQEQEQQIVI